MPNRSRTRRVATSAEIGRKTGDAAFGTATTRSGSTSYALRILSRELTDSENSSSRSNSALHCKLQLLRSLKRKVVRMFEKTDVVNADHDGHRTDQWRGVLHVQQIRSVAIYESCQIETESNKRVCRHGPALHAAGTASGLSTMSLVR